MTIYRSTRRCRSACGSGRRRIRRHPLRREQRVAVLLVGHAPQAAEHVAQVGERVLAVALAGVDQRVEHRRAMAGVGMADEQPILHAQFGRTDGVFRRVVVEERVLRNH